MDNMEFASSVPGDSLQNSVAPRCTRILNPTTCQYTFGQKENMMLHKGAEKAKIDMQHFDTIKGGKFKA